MVNCHTCTDLNWLPTSGIGVDSVTMRLVWRHQEQAMGFKIKDVFATYIVIIHLVCSTILYKVSNNKILKVELNTMLVISAIHIFVLLNQCCSHYGHAPIWIQCCFHYWQARTWMHAIPTTGMLHMDTMLFPLRASSRVDTMPFPLLAYSHTVGTVISIFNCHYSSYRCIH